MARTSLNFDFDLAPDPRARRRAPEDPMRILVLDDLAGRATQPARSATALRDRPVLSIDVDSFDERFGRIAPALSLAKFDLVFTDFDDFHPDALFVHLPIFQALRGLRARLLDPSTFAAAKAELGAASPPAATPSAGAAGGTDLERLLGGQVVASSPAAAPAPASGGIHSLIRDIVSPHVVAAPDESQPQLVAAVDQAIADLMRSVLHDPAFQRLEASWRSLRPLATELETGQELSIHVVDLTREELLADLTEGELSASALHHLIVDRAKGSAGVAPYSLIVSGFSFGADARELGALGALGALAASAGGALLANADAALLGGAVANPTSPERVAELDPELGAALSALRKSAVAPHIGLCAPRVLLRLPYGKRTEPVERFEFEELSSVRPHEGYLWGSGAYALAREIARGFVEQGWDMSLAEVHELGELPVHTFRDADGEPAMQACAEAFIAERVGHVLLDRGLIPLLSVRNQNRALIMRVQSLSDPPRALAGAFRG